MSLIWGIDTLFKMGAGLDIMQVLLTNSAFTLGSMVFEIPTGVVADTVGRRVSRLGLLGVHVGLGLPRAGLHVLHRRGRRMAGGRAPGDGVRGAARAGVR